jgi:hypothetical protein
VGVLGELRYLSCEPEMGCGVLAAAHH